MGVYVAERDRIQVEEPLTQCFTVLDRMYVQKKILKGNLILALSRIL